MTYDDDQYKCGMQCGRKCDDDQNDHQYCWDEEIKYFEDRCHESCCGHGGRGHTGHKGKDGMQCDSGRDGKPGKPGLTGPTGARGATGSTGCGFMPLPSGSRQTVYVSAGGNDYSGYGSVHQPFRTIPRALASITDASPFKRYSIQVGPGNYPENFSLRANVIINGADPVTVRIGADRSFINLNDPSWSAAGDNQSGFYNVTLLQTNLLFDFTARSSTEGKLCFCNVRSMGRPVFTAFASGNQVLIQNSLFFAGYTQNGIRMILNNTEFLDRGFIEINSSTLSATHVQAVGGGTDGSLTGTYTGGSGISIFLLGFSILGTLTATGATSVVATADSIPVNRVFASGASLTYINDAFSLGYTPSAPANWNIPIPRNVQQALDQLAARISK